MFYLLLTLFGCLTGISAVLFGFGGGFVIVPLLYRMLTASPAADDPIAQSAMHIAVAAASGNPLFRSFTSVVETALGAYLSLSTPVDGAIMAESVRQHTRIADAIEERDSARAAQTMQEVIDIGLGRVAA